MSPIFLDRSLQGIINIINTELPCLGANANKSIMGIVDQAVAGGVDIADISIQGIIDQLENHSCGVSGTASKVSEADSQYFTRSYGQTGTFGFIRRTLDSSDGDFSDGKFVVVVRGRSVMRSSVCSYAPFILTPSHFGIIKVDNNNNYISSEYIDSLDQQQMTNIHPRAWLLADWDICFDIQLNPGESAFLVLPIAETTPGSAYNTPTETINNAPVSNLFNSSQCGNGNFITTSMYILPSPNTTSIKIFNDIDTICDKYETTSIDQLNIGDITPTIQIDRYRSKANFLTPANIPINSKQTPIIQVVESLTSGGLQSSNTLAGQSPAHLTWHGLFLKGYTFNSNATDHYTVSEDVPVVDVEHKHQNIYLRASSQQYRPLLYPMDGEKYSDVDLPIAYHAGESFPYTSLVAYPGVVSTPCNIQNIFANDSVWVHPFQVGGGSTYTLEYIAPESFKSRRIFIMAGIDKTINHADGVHITTDFAYQTFTGTSCVGATNTVKHTLIINQ